MSRDLKNGLLLNISLLVLGSLFFLSFTSCGSDPHKVFARRWGFIDRTGTWVVQPQFLQEGDFSEGLAPAQARTAKWGFIDRKGNFAIEPQFDNVAAFKEGLACVEVDHKVGYIDQTGKMVIPAIYVNGRPFSEGLAEVTLNWSNQGRGTDAMVGYIDKSGKLAIQPKFWDRYLPSWDHFGRTSETIRHAGDFSEGLAGIVLYKDAQGDHRGYIDRIGGVVFELPKVVRMWTFSDNFAAVEQNQEIGFVDRTGKFVIQPRFQLGQVYGGVVFSNGLAAVALGGKLGFINQSGEMIVAPQFDWVTNFSEGLAVVKLDGGDPIYIDKTGRHVFQAFKVHADQFSEGLAAAPMRTWSGLLDLFPYVFLSGRPRWGFVNGQGETVIAPQFDDGHSFSEGLAAVAKFVWADE